MATGTEIQGSTGFSVNLCIKMWRHRICVSLFKNKKESATVNKTI